LCRLVTKNTIEEQILQLANTKLALDQSISGEGDDKALEGKGEELVAKMLLAAEASAAAAAVEEKKNGEGAAENKE
jgi:SWI/SNF-related matrix-associated actin-dependent regulator 1 of chromatin subfamily A